MKIAIASNDKNNVSEVSGRATYYLIYEDKRLIKTIKNPFAIGGGGAGFGVAKMIADEGVNLIIAGNFGNNMVNTLKEKNIQSKEVQDKTVKEVIEEVN